jgi:type IV secretory pathway TrbL component
MKKIMIGLLIGAVMAGAVCFFMMPDIKKAAYDSGYAAGNKAGMTAGTAAGVQQGIAELKAQQKHEKDSIAADAQKREEAIKKAAAGKVKKPAPIIQNWHVIDGQIAEPIESEPKQ